MDLSVSGGLLFLGFAMTVVGAYMVYLSLRAHPGEVESKGLGIIFIGPIPIILGGSRKWIVAALGVTALLMIFMLTKSMDPSLIGW
jgi:uncharacterized protein (TIGR00304 family)